VSQASRILELLRQRPHTTAEILREVPSIVHSRIATLRDRGYVITCERVDGEGANAYLYTLLCEPEQAEPIGAGRPSGSQSGVDDPAQVREYGHRPRVSDSCAALTPEQLTLEAAR
jgi:hypothetical protein